MSQDAIAHRKHPMRSRWSAIALTAASVWLVLLGHGCNSNSNGDDDAPGIGPTRIVQTKLDGTCLPKFAISLPVCGTDGGAARNPSANTYGLLIDRDLIREGEIGFFAATASAARLFAIARHHVDGHFVAEGHPGGCRAG